MVDKLTKIKRSEVMARVRSRGNASTELLLAKLFRANGMKGWRRHCLIPGKPDFSFPKSKLAVFADGCFWHGCPRCYAPPESSKKFWAKKLAKNQSRDATVNRQLKAQGWKVVRAWECSLRNPGPLLRRIARLLGLDGSRQLFRLTRKTAAP